ncbi:uncharacterized protein LOC132565299 [Ylistrum balloti]|uniref:uncharacterized protein LOC132565299 n=1 Tax=Ylistrum balloti TaxID=509963 RepID=UPI002905D069|nr:uncharacterized protein LOC132565299 [Ylistrum balloti]
MSDTSDEEDSISKIDFSVISVAIEAGHKMVQQILNCVHYGTPEVRNLMYNECDFIVECRVCRNLFRSIPNFVAHKRIYCTTEFEQTSFPSSGQEESVVVVQPTDASPGSMSPAVTMSKASSQSAPVTKSVTTKATPTGSIDNAKSVLSNVFTSSTLSQSRSRTVSQPKSGGNVSLSNVARSAQKQFQCRDKGGLIQGHGQGGQGQNENKDEEDSSDGDSSTLKQLLTGKFRGKSSEYNFYSKTAEKMERERKAKEVSHVVMTPIPTNQNAAYLTVTQSGTADKAQNVIVSSQHDSSVLIGQKKSSQSHEETMFIQNRENTVSREKKVDTELTQENLSVRCSKRKNPDVQKIVNEGPSAILGNTSLSKQKQMEQKNKKFVQLRPVKSQLGSHQYSELSELGLLGHCDLALSRCLLCSASYSSRKGLLQHMHSIHSGRKRLFPCSMCEKRFSYFWGLTRHLQNNHNLSKEKIDKMRDKLKSMAFDNADLEQEESVQKEQLDPKSRVSSGQSLDRSKQETSVQTGSVTRTLRDSETAGIKLNKCQGCKRAFWKKSNYEDHINQCKWIVTSNVTTDKPFTNSRSTSRSRSEPSRDIHTLKTAETAPNRPSTRSKAMEKDIHLVSSNVMENLESIERRARLRTRSKVVVNEQTNQQSVSLSKKGQTGEGKDNEQKYALHDEAMETDHDDSRDGSELSTPSSIDRTKHQEKSQEQKSSLSSPSKASNSSSPNTPSKHQVVTRNSTKSMEKETQYMRTRFFDKRRESQIRPDRSPQSKSGSEASSPVLQKRDCVKVVLAFEDTQDDNKCQDRSRSGSRESGKTTPSTSPDKERTFPSVAGSNEYGQKRSSLRGRSGTEKESRIDVDKSKSRDSSTERLTEGVVPEEISTAKNTRDSRERSREGSARPSTRSGQRTTESTNDKSQTAQQMSTKRDRQNSPADIIRDKSPESFKDSSSRVSTRSSSAQSSTDQSRSREETESSPTSSKKDGQNYPSEKNTRTRRDSSTENTSDRSLSRTRTRNVSASKSEDRSRRNSKDRISPQVSTRNKVSILSDGQTTEQEHSTRTKELHKVLSENITKDNDGVESNSQSDDGFRPSVRKSNRTSIGVRTDKNLNNREASKDMSLNTTEPDTHTTTETNKKPAGEPSQKISGNKPGMADSSKTVGNVQRISTRRSAKLDTKADSVIDKYPSPQDVNQSQQSPASKITAESISTLQSIVTRRSGQKDTSSTSWNSGFQSSADVTKTRPLVTRSTDPNKASGKTKEGENGVEFQKRSARIRDKMSAGNEEETNRQTKDLLQSHNKKADEVDGESSCRSTRLSSASRVKSLKSDTKNTEDDSQHTDIQVGSMIISSVTPENQSFLGLKVNTHTRRGSARASTQFTPRIPKSLESTSERRSTSKTVEKTSVSRSEESSFVDKSFSSTAEDKSSESDRSSDSDSAEPNSDYISASPEPEVQLVEEVWVLKEPGLPSEEVRGNAYAMMTYKSSPTPSASKGPSPLTSGHTTRASERMRTTRTQMYVTDPKNIGTSQETVQTRCLDLSRIAYLSDEKEMKCLQCGLGFSCLSNLRRHVVRHLGWRRYKCKLCKFSSYNKSECNTHLIRSHGTRARNCTASTLIIDLNKEASKVRSQKKINTIKSKSTGPALRSQSQRKTSGWVSKEAEVLISDKELSESKKMSQGKAKKDDRKEASAANVTCSSDHSGSMVITTRSKSAKKDNTEDSLSIKTGDSEAQSDADAAANLQMKTEELRRTRKRKRSNSFDTNPSKLESSKGETPANDTKKARKRRRSNSLEDCANEEEAASNHSESLVVPIKKKYEMKRSTSLDGACSNSQEDVGETLSDSWDIPSVSDFENSDTEMVCSPPSAKVVPNLETMMAALEEARAFKFVRQRGKGRRSLPLIKKTQRSGSLGSQTDSHVELVSENTASNSSVEVTKTQTEVLEVSGVSSASTGSKVNEDKCMTECATPVRQKSDSEKCLSQVNDGSSSDTKECNKNLTGVKDSSSSVENIPSKTQELLPNIQANPAGEKDILSSVDNKSSGKHDSSDLNVESSGEIDSSLSMKDNSSVEKESSSGMMDSSSEVKDNSSVVKESFSSVKDNSSGMKDGLSSVKDDSFGEVDSSSGVKDNSLGEEDSSSGVKGNSSIVKDCSIGKKDTSSDEKNCSSEVEDSSSGEKVSSSGVEDSSSGEKVSSSGVEDSSSGEKVSSSGVEDSSSGKKVSSSGERDKLSCVEESSSGEKESSSSTKEGFVSSVGETRNDVTDSEEVLSCLEVSDPHQEKSLMAETDKCTEVEKSLDLVKEAKEYKNMHCDSVQLDETRGQQDTGDTDMSVETQQTVQEDVDLKM